MTGKTPLKSRGFFFFSQTEVTAILGSCDGDKAKKNRTTKIKTGSRRNIQGGGGNGGRTSGSNKTDTVNITMTMIDLTLKNRTIKL